MSFIGAIIIGLAHMDIKVMDATVAQDRTHESSTKYKAEENRCNNLTREIFEGKGTKSLKELKALTSARITNIKNHLSNLDTAEKRTRIYMEDSFLGQYIDQSPKRVLWTIQNMKTAYEDLLLQQTANLKKLNAL